LALLLLPACGDLDLPPGCQDVLTARSDEVRCTSETRCEQVQADPGFVARWYLHIDEYRQNTAGDDIPYSASAMADRRNCVADYLDNRGITLIDRGSESSPFVIAEGIAANFDAVLEFSPVEAYSLYCSGEVCEHCEQLAEAECSSDAFCWAMYGRPYDTTNDCLSASSFTHCASGDQSCGGAETWASDPQGACWAFPSTCTPSDFEDQSESCPAGDLDPPDCL
jgi:hypothetical protein